jgi:hypothetical protein
MSMKHVIMKQVIDLRVNPRLNAFLVQQQAKEYYYHHIVPAIEKIFDEISSTDEVISINELEVDLGELVWKNDRFALDDTALYKILKESFKKNFATPEKSSTIPINISRRTNEETTCLQWLYYMETGALPWEIQGTNTTWNEKVLYQLAIDHMLIQKTKTLIVNNHWFLMRIIKDHDDIFLKKLTEIITAKTQSHLLENIRKSAGEFVNGSHKVIRTRTEIWAHILRSVAAGDRDVDIQKILLDKKVVALSQSSSEFKEIAEGLYCHFAGLILLHPFFKHLFSRLNLLELEKFKDQLSKYKAIVLLYFIATGRTEGKDHEFVVPKILCGLHLYEVLPEQSMILTTNEKQEALNMMCAAIEQWTILHNTSPEGLREGFLAREGKVLISNTAIEFRIETSAIDVLLDHLPWNLSLIKLPWLTQLIRVEWR